MPWKNLDRLIIIESGSPEQVERSYKVLREDICTELKKQFDSYPDEIPVLHIGVEDERMPKEDYRGVEEPIIEEEHEDQPICKLISEPNPLKSAVFEKALKLRCPWALEIRDREPDCK
jgi:hypothetical protein